MTIHELTGAGEKRALARRILEALPDWFGLPESREQYIQEAGELPCFEARLDDTPAGFLCIKRHYPESAELSVMSVLPEAHRQGVGRALVAACLDWCRAEGVRFLQVKALDEVAHSESYDRTRRFYRAMGFVPLECFPTLWDEWNPCLLLVRTVDGGCGSAGAAAPRPRKVDARLSEAAFPGSEAGESRGTQAPASRCGGFSCNWGW